MTIREHLKAKLNKARVIGVISLVAFATVGILTSSSDQVSPLFLIPFAAFGGSVVYILYVIRCSRCNTRMGQVMSQFRTTNYCPQCGVNLDEEYSENEDGEN